ncbi:MAG TPA: 7-carboxy-7-deazaguanine synthase QueE [Fimbriimonas sp.]|nr:7-carboxy-7-deazaguanine synthase QueE [Fimbriimonas sp.]
MALKISEIFHSVQGEGLLMGVPSTFVRVSGCNLRCVWCDTPYASWNPEGSVMSVPEIVEKVQARDLRHVVLTGGEPMIFGEIEELCAELARRGIHITIETAGTVHRSVPCDLMSISPKLAHSTPVDDMKWGPRHEELRLNVEALTALLGEYECQLKFVVAAAADVAEIQKLLSLLPSVLPERICLMPEGRDSATLWERARALVPVVMEHGWRIAPRMQIDLFGDTRGT